MSEATPISELFSRDPLLLSDQDIDQIINKLREQRHKFVAGNITAGKPEAKKSVAQKAGEAVLAKTGDIDLSELGL